MAFDVTARYYIVADARHRRLLLQLFIIAVMPLFPLMPLRFDAVARAVVTLYCLFFSYARYFR